MYRLYEGMSIREVSEFLFVRDEPENADLIFVFGGKRRERAEKAAQLYHQGWAGKIWISGGDRRSTGIPEAEALRNAAVEAGVPPEAISIETSSINSLENVALSCPQLEARYGWSNLKRIMVVTSPVHMRRAQLLLSRHCPAGTRLICCPDDRADVRADNWWTTREGLHLVLRELEKVRHLMGQA